MNNLFTSPLKFRLFLFSRLPSAWLAGLRMVSCTEQEARVSIRYGWWTKNPFRSLYFACLAMAAEMSTGALAWMYASKHTPMVSMLVVKMEAEFLKKAIGKIIFTCSDGNGFSDVVKRAVETGEGQTFRSATIGKDEEGNEVARFYITWSFKTRIYGIKG